MLTIRMFRLLKKGGRGICVIKRNEKKKKDPHAERREGANGVPTRVLHERARDDLEGVRDGAEGARLDSRDRARASVQADRDGHLDRAATGHERRVEDDVARDGHGVGQVAVDLVQDVFGRPAEEDGARFGGRAFGQEGEVSAWNGGWDRRVSVRFCSLTGGEVVGRERKGLRASLVAHLFDVE